MEMTGLEPVTPCLQSRCSSQLSYIPEAVQVGARIPERRCRSRTRPVAATFWAGRGTTKRILRQRASLPGPSGLVSSIRARAKRRRVTHIRVSPGQGWWLPRPIR